MGIDLTDGLNLKKTPEHYITFGSFDSRSPGLHLHERKAPTPDEKTITVSIPHAQGVADFSAIRGVRNYENREIIYTFYAFGVAKENANAYQTTIENLIMQEFNQVLQDSYDPDYHYLGKCSGIEVEDDYEFKRLIVEITFDLYPFKIGNRLEGNDDWDSFNFKIDVFQDVKFTIGAGETASATIYNVSQNTHSPTLDIIITSGTVSGSGSYFMVANNGVSYSFPAGTTESSRLRLLRGKNELTFNCSVASVAWTIEFGWHKELI